MQPCADREDQRAVIDFLSSPASYGLRDGKVEKIVTHCSIVFLAGDRAYKLKQAIRYASLDYTTLTLRQAACEAELALNRRTAPDLYLDVQSIHRDAGGGLMFNGPGPALDYVVVMRRFAQSDLFDHMAEHGMLTRDLMQTLGTVVARFHLAAEITPALGGSHAIRRVMADNDQELAHVAAALDGAAVTTLSRRAHDALDKLAPLLDRRRAEGKIRRCHGDLRLANICLYSGRPTLFDCIEFSEEIGCIDVLYDLAFLLMDLQLGDHGDLGNAVFNAYLDAAPETAGLHALPLFLALRAATRSYALAGKAGRAAEPRQAARLLAFARRHIDAGIDFLTPEAPLLVGLGGAITGGRADLAASLAALIPPVPGARLLRLAARGDMAWSEASALLAAGCSILAEGGLASAAERSRAAALASTAGVRFIGLWLGALPAGSDPRLWRSVDTGQGALAALADAALLVTAAQTHRPRSLYRPLLDVDQ